MSQETYNLFLCAGNRHLLYGLYFRRVYLNTLVTDEKTQKLTRPYFEVTLVRIQPQLICLQPVKHFLEMIKVLFLSLRPGYHIINIHFDLVVNHIMEQSDHGSLISCPSILLPKRHHLVAEGAPLYNEGCLLHVLRSHLDLFVAREAIHEGEYFVLGSVVN